MPSNDRQNSYWRIQIEMVKKTTESGSRRWQEIKSVASGPAILLGLTASMGGVYSPHMNFSKI